MDNFINVFSEIGKLKKVLLHRPGIELNGLHPEYLAEMLFEDTPYLSIAQQEHDTFAEKLKENGVEIFYLRDMFKIAMENPQAKKEFTEEFVDKSFIRSLAMRNYVLDYYNSKSGEEFIDAILKGVRKDEIDMSKQKPLAYYVMGDYPYIVDPLSAIYYMRDNSISVGNGSIISNMSMKFRKREPILLKYIHKYVPQFSEGNIKHWYDDTLPYGIEGGDVAVFSDKVVGIGCSERTSCGAIEFVAGKLLSNGFEKVLVFNMIEKKRATMHLDDILTMIDYDKFIINAMMDEKEKINVYELSLDSRGKLQTIPHSGSLKEIFEEALNIENVKLIKCGGGDLIDGIREMWNLGANVLTIEPGKVIAFGRNDITNKQLRDIGVEVIEIPHSELVKGRGGPRCMSMPLYRENI